MILRLLAVALAACTSYDASFVDCAVRCDLDGTCPDGLTCGDEGRCREPGQTTTCSAVLGAFPSCTGLAPTCGADALGDCCSTATTIPGGTFLRSYDVATDGLFADMSSPATVSAFRLDKYEVTVGRFRRFVEAGGGPPEAGAGAHAKIPSSGWDPSWNSALVVEGALGAALKCDPAFQTWTDVAGANETLPINCVTWYDAFAFCAWDDGYLPTETEWNFAAAGGDEQRAYPWSAPASSLAVDCTHANYSGCSIGPSPVGLLSAKGDGRWSHTDLAGNILEWTLDGFAPYTPSCDDCAGLSTTTGRVVRGGNWANATPTLRGGIRNFTITLARDTKIGFRCARE